MQWPKRERWKKSTWWPNCTDHKRRLFPRDIYRLQLWASLKIEPADKHWRPNPNSSQCSWDDDWTICQRYSSRTSRPRRRSRRVKGIPPPTWGSWCHSFEGGRGGDGLGWRRGRTQSDRTGFEWRGRTSGHGGRRFCVIGRLLKRWLDSGDPCALSQWWLKKSWILSFSLAFQEKARESWIKRNLNQWKKDEINR